MSELEKSLGRKDRQTFEKKFKVTVITDMKCLLV